MAINHISILNRGNRYYERKLGVTYTLAPPRSYGMPDETALVFHSFIRLQGERYPKTKKGDGKRVLKSICKYCDKHGLSLILWCVPELVRYYKELGFVTLAKQPERVCFILIRRSNVIK